VSELDPAEFRSRLERLVADRWPGARVVTIDRIPAGVSSLAYRAEVLSPHAASTRPIVVKVAPVGLPATSNRDVLRQARLMAAVGDRTRVPVPEILLTDDSVAPPLFAMEWLDGHSYEPGTDVTDTPPAPSEVTARCLVAAEVLATLQAVRPEALGAGDEPVVSPEGELRRWSRLLETVDDDICPGHEVLRDRLSHSVPRSLTPVITHGDYRLANMIFDGPELLGVIDWEIWSVGDPRHDLAWLLLHLDPPHRFHRTRPATDLAAAGGLPSVPSVLDHLASCGAPVEDLASDLPWFLALCAYKIVSTVGVIAKRNRRLPEPVERIIIAQESLPDVLAAGHRWLDDGVTP
jgi:aminoglycoside phosphotransferase (APT) family kinase protein